MSRSIYDGCNYGECDPDIRDHCNWREYCVLAGEHTLEHRDAARALYNLMRKVFEQEQKIIMLQNRLDFFENKDGEFDLK